MSWLHFKKIRAIINIPTERQERPSAEHWSSCSTWPCILEQKWVGEPGNPEFCGGKGYLLKDDVTTGYFNHQIPASCACLLNDTWCGSIHTEVKDWSRLVRALAEAELPFLLVQPEDFPEPSGNWGSYYTKANLLALEELFALHKYSVNG